MDTIRTPDDRFAGLPGWPFEPHYTEVPSGDGGTLRIHHIDEGPVDGEVVLCLHGEPSWGYLYRKMVPVLTGAGLRVLVPDLVGFGRSDKPTSRDDYTYQRHVDWMTAWMEAVDLQHATLVGQDWGGLIGLRLAAEHPDRFDRLVAANTFLPTGDRPPGEAFLRVAYLQPGDAGVPRRAHRGGGLRHPAARPGRRRRLRRAVPRRRATWPAPASSPPSCRSRPTIRRRRRTGGRGRCSTAGSARCSARSATATPSPPAPTACSCKRVPGTKGMPHTTIEGGGHFLQEDKGEELAAAVVAFVRATPRPA